MTTISEIIFSGFVSKVINDTVDVSRDKIKRVVRNKNTKHQNIESQIYNLIVNVLNRITNNRYKNNQDSVYDAAEVLLKSIIENSRDGLESIKKCLRALDSKVDDNECLKFKVSLYEELSKDGYNELFRSILLLLLDQKSRYDNAIYVQLSKKMDEVILILNQKENGNVNSNIKQKAKSRTQEYADKWNENMFLNDFDKRDENAGVNVKLGEVYLEEHLPHYIWEDNDDGKPLPDLKYLLSEYINEKRGNKMLLILGQPGIGKSTLITWSVVNFNDRIKDILVYKFSSDLINVDWQDNRISNKILEKLNLSCDDLNGKTLILDGFDEVNIEEKRRRDILDSLYGDWIYNRTIDNFSLIITCRENYVQRFAILKCKYITLQQWNKKQIRSFCNIYQEKTKSIVSESTIKKLIEKKCIFGIPLILYMVLALNIAIEQEGSIVDVYDKIFALDGGIYDRCIDNKMFAEKHRISKMKKQIHQISEEIAIWMFKNKPDEATISQEEYHKICDNITKEVEINSEKLENDFLIATYFKLVRHCEGIETQKVYFVHRTIYEYFVAETIYNSIESSLIELSEESKEVLAGNIAVYLTEKGYTKTISDYLDYKILKLYNNLSQEKKMYFFQWWEETFEKMLKVGMFFYTGQSVRTFKNIIRQEMQCFRNLLDILRGLMSISERKYFMRSTKILSKYIEFCRIEYGEEIEDEEMRLDFKKINLSYLDLRKTNLSNLYLEDINLNGSNLTNANFSGAYLKFASFQFANVSKANLTEANLIKADFRGADLTDTNLTDAKLNGSKWYMNDVKKAFYQLETAKFKYIIVEDYEKRKCSRKRLFENNSGIYF